MKSNPKWLGRILHILFFIGITAWFVYTRMIHNTGIPLDSEPIKGIFDAARVGGSGIQSANCWERWYLQALSSLFLFLGNKILVILYFQIVLQCISFLLFIYIGWTIYHGIWGWTLSALYVFVPYTTDLVLNVTYINFWICIALIIISLLCIPIRVWKRKKRKIFAKQKITEVTEEENNSNNSDSSHLESSMTETLKTEAYDWNELQQEMENPIKKAEDSSPTENISNDEMSEDTGVIRVSDIIKAVSNDEVQTDSQTEEPVINKTDMIENLLPMPKKHISRTFEYSFEPSQDLMHYDVELENDDYDYE